MPADRLLNTVLQFYQDVHDDAKTEQIYGSTTSLFTTLTNPLNLSLLTSQLLLAPAIWHRPDGLRTCLRIISIYNTAAIHVRRNELEKARPQAPRLGLGLKSETWAKAVAEGADDRSARWQHLLVLAGVLMGMEGNDRQSLSRSLRNTLEGAVVTAANLALQMHRRDGPVAGYAIVLALTYVLPLLSDDARSRVHCDELLPLAIRSITGEEGFQGGVFLDKLNADTRQMPDRRISWQQSSVSFRGIKLLESLPMVGSLGPLSKLASYAVEHSKDSRSVLDAQDELQAFTAEVMNRWQAIKLSEVDVPDEAACLTEETRQITSPALWHLLKRLMYAIVAVSQSITARSLLDPQVRRDAIAASVAAKSLHILRNMSFITLRDGSNSFQVYIFTYLTSIDMLARYPDAAVGFLREIRSTNPDVIPAQAFRRILDLFYLNVAEHLPLNLAPEMCETLIVQPAMAYLAHETPLSPRMVELFESAHSAILSVLSCPHNAAIAVNIVPFYVECLLNSFPFHISPRQFRLAFKTLMQIVSPPFPVSATHPELAETLLEMLRFRISTSETTPIPPTADTMSQPATESQHPEPMSEQSTLVLTLVDVVPYLPLEMVDEWLAIAAASIHEIHDPHMKEMAKRRVWEILTNGELDVERAARGVAWWGTRGGRELVLFGHHDAGAGRYLMSGAIADIRGQSKL